MEGTRTVLQAMAGLPDWTHRHIARCVGEMTGGMAEMMTELDGAAPQGLPDLRDTLQYCYYVAGTVGVMLTGLFVDGYDSVRPRGSELEPRAPAFGRALQLTNILKDIRAQRRAVVQITGDVKVFSDERDDTVRDHGYDTVKYDLIMRPRVADTPAPPPGPPGQIPVADYMKAGVEERRRRGREARSAKPVRYGF